MRVQTPNHPNHVRPFPRKPTFPTTKNFQRQEILSAKITRPPRFIRRPPVGSNSEVMCITFDIYTALTAA
jgi:hypothetical protein